MKIISALNSGAGTKALIFSPYTRSSLAKRLAIPEHGNWLELVLLRRLVHLQNTKRC